VRAPDADPAALRLTLYGRSYCHLCEEMLAALAPLRHEFGFAVDVVDVDRTRRWSSVSALWYRY